MTTITVNPNAPMSAAAGQPYTHTTFDGQTMHGVTEVNAEDRLIVRFPDGRWAFASFEYVTTAPTTYTAWVCVDCYLSAAGYSDDELGYTPDREPMALLAEDDATPGLIPSEHAPDCAVFLTGDWQHECECAVDSFSMQDCDGCGSCLAGERHGMTVSYR